MAKMPRDDDGLTPQESRAAALRAQGLSQADAYRQAFDVKRATQKTVIEKASRLFAKGNMKARVRDLLKAARVTDIESVGEAFDVMLSDMEAARNDGNHNATAQYTRIKMQVHGVLKDNVALTVEQRASDEELIRCASAGDPAVAAVLRKLLGAPDTFGETRH
jgi:hypothetical protein